MDVLKEMGTRWCVRRGLLRGGACGPMPRTLPSPLSLAPAGPMTGQWISNSSTSAEDACDAPGLPGGASRSSLHKGPRVCTRMPPARPGDRYALCYGTRHLAKNVRLPRASRGHLESAERRRAVAKNVRLPRTSRGHLEHVARRQGTKPSHEIQCMQCQHFARLRSRPPRQASSLPATLTFSSSFPACSAIDADQRTSLLQITTDHREH